MQRYFISNLQVENDEILINDNDLHHMLHVLRMKNNDYFECVDENGIIYLCSLNNNKAIIIKTLFNCNELPIKVNLIYGLPRNEKFEFVLQKACELGVTTITPYLAKRSIIKTDKSKFFSKYERYNKILKEAAEQSKRNIVPVLNELINLDEIGSYIGEYNLVAYEESAKEGEMTALRSVLDRIEIGDTLSIIVGPEGGFDDTEISRFNEYGFVCCGLGKRILRTETAPLYILSAISYALELK